MSVDLQKAFRESNRSLSKEDIETLNNLVDVIEVLTLEEARDTLETLKETKEIATLKGVIEVLSITEGIIVDPASWEVSTSMNIHKDIIGNCIPIIGLDILDSSEDLMITLALEDIAIKTLLTEEKQI